MKEGTLDPMGGGVDLSTLPFCVVGLIHALLNSRRGEVNSSTRPFCGVD